MTPARSTVVAPLDTLVHSPPIEADASPPEVQATGVSTARDSVAELGGTRHRDQLDSVRALAVLTVLIQHFIPQTQRWVPLGGIGVRVFFTLSGFLITGILLKARADAGELLKQARPGILCRFYIRRSLRIFPIFYLTLLLTGLCGSRPVHEGWRWHVAYLSNVYFFLRGAGNDSVTHFWSLAVEEQFYLVWPALILSIPRRWLTATIVLLAATAPIVRAALLYTGHNTWQASVLTPSCLDTLGLGGLLALVRSSMGVAAARRFATTCIWAGFAISVATGAVGVVFGWTWTTVTADTATALCSVWLINGAYDGFTGWAAVLLSWSPLVRLGLISYAVYVVHNFVPSLVDRLPLRPIALAGSLPGLQLATKAFVTISLAALSWRYLESPINRLKRFVPYVTTRG